MNSTPISKPPRKFAQGAGCSSCTGGQGTFNFSYTTGNPSESGYNIWRRKTVETLPDGNQNIVFTNYRGQIMLQAFKDTTTSEQWITYFRFDDDGRVAFRAEPSAVSGYDENYNALVQADGQSVYAYLRDNED